MFGNTKARWERASPKDIDPELVDNCDLPCIRRGQFDAGCWCQSRWDKELARREKAVNK